MNHIHPLQPIAVIVLAAILIYMNRKKFLRTPPPAPVVQAKAEDPPEVTYMKLRRQALEMDAGRFGGAAEDPPYGALMEMGISNSVVTLACFADGDASVYYRTGGGMIGGVAHESVRKAAKEFVTLAQTALPKMTAAAGSPLPGPDRVRFYVLTARGIFTTETDRQALGQPQSELSTLFYSGQGVVTQMRQVQERKSAGAAESAAPKS
ncbi:MAG TPA: hypothetical protein VOA87_05755 [Thermoanaerobaculia bacterium]|nr:hypothetical protein [Thermoanaerobaculia bacterium]